MDLLTRKRLAILFVFSVLVVAAAVVSAQVDDLPATYLYCGRELTRAEIMERYESGVPLYCLQLPTASSYVNMMADAFACFDTGEERDAYAETLKPEYERIEREYPAPQREPPQSEPPHGTRSNH